MGEIIETTTRLKDLAGDEAEMRLLGAQGKINVTLVWGWGGAFWGIPRTGRSGVYEIIITIFLATPTYLGSHFHIKIGLIQNTIGITNCMCYFYWTFNKSLPVYQQVRTD